MELRSQIMMDLLRLEGKPGIHELDYPCNEVRNAAAKIGGFCVRPDIDGTLVAYIGDGTGGNPLDLENRLKQASNAETGPFIIVGYKRSYVMEKMRRAGVTGFKVQETENGVMLTPKGYKVTPRLTEVMAMSEVTPEQLNEVLEELEKPARAIWHKIPYDVRDARRIAPPSFGLGAPIDQDEDEDEIGPPDADILVKRSWEDDEERI